MKLELEVKECEFTNDKGEIIKYNVFVVDKIALIKSANQSIINNSFSKKLRLFFVTPLNRNYYFICFNK